VPGRQSMAGFERVIAHVLKTGTDLVATSINMDRDEPDDIVDRLFPLYALEERNTVRRLFTERRPRIVHGFPRGNGELPAVMILVSNESESRRAIGDLVTDDGDEIEFIGRRPERIEGVMVESSVELWIMDNNPDTVLAYYTLLWAIMDGARRKVFAPLELHAGQLSGGDVAPDSNYMPEYVFARRIGFSLTGMRTVAFGDELWEGITLELQLQS